MRVFSSFSAHLYPHYIILDKGLLCLWGRVVLVWSRYVSVRHVSYISFANTVKYIMHLCVYWTVLCEHDPLVCVLDSAL